ncbi:MAG: hypothetical protein ACJ749_15355 [Flavisolibacter sp.]
MNTFLSASVLIQNTLATYEIFQRRDRYKALLILDEAHPGLPLEFTFWKEDGQWKSMQMMDEYVLYQFGYIIDNHLLTVRIEQLKNIAVA